MYHLHDVSVCPPIQPGVVLKDGFSDRVVESLSERGDGTLSEELEAEVTPEALTKMEKTLVKAVIDKNDDKVGMKLTSACLLAGVSMSGCVFMVLVLLLPYTWNFFLVCAVSGGSCKAVQWSIFRK